MQPAIHNGAKTIRAINVQQFPPLEQVNRPTVPTEQAAYYLLRRPQTLRAWAMNSGKGPVSFVRIHGRLGWVVADIRRVLGVEVQ